MTVEEKAKSYDEALQRARELNSGKDVDVEAGTTTCEYIFPELKEGEDERIKREIRNFIWEYPDKLPERDKWLAWFEKQDKKKSVDEVLKIRQELYQSGYNDGYKHGQEDIAISLEKKSIEALEHFVRSIGESGYASPYDNRTKLVYTLLERLKQIVK